MFIKDYVVEKAKAAKEVSRKLASLSTDIKNKALLVMAEALRENFKEIIQANKKDIKLAKKKNLSKAMIDRLTLNSTRIESMASGLEEVANLPDPVGEIIKMWERPNGLQIGKMRVPLGVLAIIYESRPNVTSDVAGLCLKSGNAVILRGGSESINSNIIITKLLTASGQKVGIPKETIQIIEMVEREVVRELLKLVEYIDVVIPRGGEALIKTVVENSRIPIIKHCKGVCHVYVDREAKLKMAEEISFNAKVQRPGVCNAMETLLVHKDIAKKFLLPMIKKFEKAGVEIRGCEKTRRIVPQIKKAREEDWTTEYLDLLLAVKVVGSFKEALAHINKYGSQHSDAIITESYSKAREFLKLVDSAAVYVNASTRFTDGNQFGLGAEIGISTQKLHARGPVGLEELTTYKYIIFGSGQVRR